MAYNYNGYQNYYGNLYGNNYTPNMTQQNLQYQQPANYNGQNYNSTANMRIDGFPSYFVDTYDQVRQANVAADGTPSIFISNVEDRFWLKKTNTENGRTIVKTFVFSEDTEEQNGGNKTLMKATNDKTSTQQNIENTGYIKKEELNQILAPLIEEMEIIKTAIYTSANTIEQKETPVKTNTLSENKLKIPD